VRIELRALPSGPTVEDLLANTAFLIGLSLGLAPAMEEIQSNFEFDRAHHNFYRAAQSGLEAQLDWPAMLGGSERPMTAQRLFPKLAETAREGLRTAGIDPCETDPLIDCLLERVEKAQTGSVWQRANLAAHASDHGREEALRRMFEDYSSRSSEGQPVHRWSIR
jgi:hypothetical protein